MILQPEPGWNYPDGSETIPDDPVTFTTVPFPVSPTSITGPSPGVPLPPSTTQVSLQTPTHNRTRKHNSKTSTTSSSLLNPKELSIEDDWTRVKCPKEKKRIQNRVAQRTYRHRMKARLGELQARLDSHERQKVHGGIQSSGKARNGVFGASANLNHNASTPDSVGGVNNPGSVDSLLPTQRGVDASSSPLTNEQRRITVPVLQAEAGREHIMEDSEPAFYSHNAQYLHSPPNSHSSPQAPHGLLSPPGRPDLDQSNRVSQDFVLDCLRFQTQLTNRLSTVEQETRGHGQAQYSSSNSSMPQVIDSLDQDRMGCMGTFTPAHMHSLDFPFDSSTDDWRTEAFGLKTRSSQSPIGLMHFPPAPDSAIPSLETMLDSSILPQSSKARPSPQRGSGTEEMVESVLRHAHNTGFDTFEEVATAYYKTKFRDSTPLSMEQHLSRSKRLPRLISDVYQATEGWPHWERRGFRDEVLKTATTILNSEASPKQTPLASSLFSKDVLSSTGSLELMKKTFQQELPSTWAVNQALVGERNPDFCTNGSNITLATVLLQRFSGQVPKKQLLRVLEACL